MGMGIAGKEREGASIEKPRLGIGIDGNAGREGIGGMGIGNGGNARTGKSTENPKLGRDGSDSDGSVGMGGIGTGIGGSGIAGKSHNGYRARVDIDPKMVERFKRRIDAALTHPSREVCHLAGMMRQDFEFYSAHFGVDLQYRLGRIEALCDLAVCLDDL